MSDTHTCSACGQTGFISDEMATDQDTLDLFGGPTCNPCADNQAACECCGHVTSFDPVSGWLCADCKALDDVHGYEFQRGEAKAAGHFN